MNIFPLSCISNLCRRKSSNRITWQMQFVLCFAGLRGAIAFALALNMPGPNAETYTTVTLTICAVTTVICGGFTEKILGIFDMKETDEAKKRRSQSSPAENGRDDDQHDNSFDDDDENNLDETQEQSGLFDGESQNMRKAYNGLKGLWAQFDFMYLRPLFGGSDAYLSPSNNRIGNDQNNGLGHYELGNAHLTERNTEEEKDPLWRD